MINQEKSAAWAETALRYLDALDTRDIALLAELWEQAAADPQLEQVLGELTDGLAIEEESDPAWEADAERVRSLFREHLPSAFSSETEPPPLTVGVVAARLEADSVLGKRLSAADKAANERLRSNPTPIPDELGLPHFEKWKASLSVSASSHYWRAFRQAAVLLMMGRCQQASEQLAAARRSGQSPKGGRS